jgi:hypothetical protein
MRNNRHSNGRPRFFNELMPLATAISSLAPANVRSAEHSDRDALVAAQRKRQAKQQRRLLREH